MTEKALPKGVAVVTGAAGGMGSATALQLAEAGWSELLLCDVDASSLATIAAPLRESGAKVEIVGEMFSGSERILAVNLDATVRLVDAIRNRMAPGSAAVLFASNSSYFPMPPEAAAAFTAPLPPEGAVSLVHLAPVSDIDCPLSKLGVRALVKREAKSFGERGAQERGSKVHERNFCWRTHGGNAILRPGEAKRGGS